MAVVSDIILAGTAAGIPAASSVNDGYLYFETDTGILKRSNGSAWVQVAASGTSGAFIKADGSVAFGGDQSMGTHKLTNVVDPASAQDAATKNYVDGIAANLGKRARVRAATTANITISTALNNADTLDGVTLATGDLVLVKNQSAAEENGVYVVGVSPARFAEFDTYDEHPGSLIAIEEGTTNADKIYLCTSNIGGTLNTTAIAFSILTASSVASDSIWDTKGDLAVATAADTASKLAVGSNGQVLTADSGETTGLKWATPATGGTLLKSFWDPDAPPASPSGTDSEFNGGSSGVPSGFTEYDPGTLLTVTESSTKKHVELLAASTAVTLDVLGIYKAIPAGDFTIWTKANFLGLASNYNFIGLCLWEDATDSTKKVAGYGLSPRGATVLDNGIYNFTNWNTFASATESNLQFVGPCVYIRLRRTSTTYKLAFSSTGKAFIEYGSAVNPAFTPTHFGVGIGNTTGANALGTFEFFRYVASDVGATGILAGQLAGIYQ